MYVALGIVLLGLPTLPSILHVSPELGVDLVAISTVSESYIYLRPPSEPRDVRNGRP